MKKAAKKPSSPSLKRYTFSHVNFIIFALIFAAIGGYVIYRSFAAWTTNLAQLDDGTCGHNLQIGSDKSASSSNMPSIYIMGDGGLSKYDAYIDGNLIGNFSSAGNGNVCVNITVTLSEGTHRFTATETQPHAGNQISNIGGFMDFLVDTIPPPAPSAPVLSAYSDSGIVGDNITKFRNINFTGSSLPSLSIQIFNGPTGLGGAKADINGNWTTTTTALNDGTYNISASAFDSAGNKSASSAGVQVIIDQNAPEPGGSNTVPSAPVLNTLSIGNNTVTINWSAPSSNGGLSIDQYKIYRGSSPGSETFLANIAAPAISYTDNTAQTNSKYYYQVSAHNSVGEGPRSNEKAAIPGDANGDGHVTQGDLTILAANFGTSASFCDFNHDGIVNFLDVSLIMSNFGL